MSDTENQKYISSPIEDIFGIEQGTTLSNVQSHEGEVVTSAGDQEDKEIAQQLATVYGYAIDAYETQTEIVQSIDPKFAARNAEVAAQYLTIALNTVNTRAKIKNEKEKLKIQAGTPGTVNNNLIIADRNELLKIMNG